MMGRLFLSVTNTIVREGEWTHQLRLLCEMLNAAGLKGLQSVVVDFWKTGILTVLKWSLNDWFIVPVVTVIKKVII